MSNNCAAGAWQCGVARRDITPPAGIDLSGFIARQDPCSGVHDPLTATALVVTDGVERAALISCDLIGLGANLVRRLRAAVAQRSGIPAAHQMYAATHTHGGPETGVIGSTGAADPAYLIALERSLVELVAEASAALAPARLGWARGSCAVAVNRRAPAEEPGPVDHDLIIARIDALAGQPLATLLHYSCHPVAAGAENRLATADWCGVARAALEGAGSGPGGATGPPAD